MVKENLVICLVQREEIFQAVPYLVEEAHEKGKKKKTCNADPKIAMKILFRYPPSFPCIKS